MKGTESDAMAGPMIGPLSFLLCISVFVGLHVGVLLAGWPFYSSDGERALGRLCNEDNESLPI